MPVTQYRTKTYREKVPDRDTALRILNTYVTDTDCHYAEIERDIFGNWHIIAKKRIKE